MEPNHEILAFRYSETLTLQVYQATDTFPRQAPPPLIERLRQLTTSISSSLLDGCARSQREAAIASWQTALGLLEALADDIDEADHRGLFLPDQVLELLESQSRTWVQVLILIRGSNQLPFAHQIRPAA